MELQRTVKMHTGKDNLIRVADVKVPNGMMVKLSCYLYALFGVAFLWGLAAQDDPGVKLTLQKIEILNVNKEYIKDPQVALFQFNSTHQAINASGTLLKDLGMDLKDNADIYTIESAGPHLLTTAKDIRICDILSGDFPELEELFKFGNFTKCPIKAGFYIGSNAIIDTRSVPSSVPKGEFIIDIKTNDGETEIMHSKTYLKMEEVPAKKSK
ncbi:hypothetical protein RI129_003189 [Pyrocoelia pectoralis]|uniref:Uncharacterized protein n=1 Tax=Pyrocoelia pectoralis TaxID=417401 RepID=A0AAN7VHP0_9COLE